jgi:hypothetical protein
VAFLSNAIDGPTRIFTQAAFDLVVPALAGAEKVVASPAAEASVPPTFDASRYVGRYESYWGEAVVVPWQDGLALLALPTEKPKQGLEKLRHVEGNTFRRVRENGELAEALIFEVDADGKVTRAVRHGNAMEKVR